MDDLIRVALANNQIEAEIMVATLEAEGIRAMWRVTDSAWHQQGCRRGRVSGLDGLWKSWCLPPTRSVPTNYCIPEQP